MPIIGPNSGGTLSNPLVAITKPVIGAPIPRYQILADTAIISSRTSVLSDEDFIKIEGLAGPHDTDSGVTSGIPMNAQ